MHVLIYGYQLSLVLFRLLCVQSRLVQPRYKRTWIFFKYGGAQGRRTLGVVPVFSKLDESKILLAAETGTKSMMF